MGRTPEVADFLELGLLLIVTGIAGVLVGVSVMVLLLKGGGHQPDVLAVVLSAFAFLGAMLFAILVRRLYRFLTGTNQPFHAVLEQTPDGMTQEKVLPRWRTGVNPKRERTFTTSRPKTTGSFLCSDGQRAESVLFSAAQSCVALVHFP